MTVEEFVSLVGKQLRHTTAASNLACIQEHGLRSPESLAELAGYPRDDLILRRARPTLRVGSHDVTLNDQKPLWAGRDHDFLDGCTLAEWSAQLDRRVFFWPGKRGGQNFASGRIANETDGVTTLEFSTFEMFDAFADHLHIAPINTGAATRRPTRRGMDIYMNVAQGSVREFRTRRALSSPDTVVEVSLTQDILPDLFERLVA
jgi:hypothetical protein